MPFTTTDTVRVFLTEQLVLPIQLHCFALFTGIPVSGPPVLSGLILHLPEKATQRHRAAPVYVFAPRQRFRTPPAAQAAKFSPWAETLSYTFKILWLSFDCFEVTPLSDPPE